MTESIPPLPNLEIGGITKKSGISQEEIDRILHIVYERRPDFYTRMAQREGDFPEKVERDPNAGPHDAFVKEFDAYIRAELGKEIDATKTSVMTAIFWEIRRRARLMYGLPITNFSSSSHSKSENGAVV